MPGRRHDWLSVTCANMNTGLLTAPARSRHIAGFTLMEMAVALVVLALLLGSLIVPLQTQVEQRKITETQRTLEMAMEALLGFAAVRGRLPCPAWAPNGVEDPPGGGPCNHPFDGFFPAATLGINPVDTQGYLLDAWGLPQNRMRYAVTNTSPGCAANAYTTPGGMRACWTTMTGGGAAPTLTVCSTATGIVAGDCAAGATLTSAAPAVIFSLGKNAPAGGTGADEAHNLDGNRTFIWHTPTGTNAANGEFDDIMVWMSPNVLYSRMISAGQLP
jgi:prepilin-type N-terminal cleavage/methylation domain-containing protein